MSLDPEMERSEVSSTVYAYFNAGKEKEFAAMAKLHASSHLFTKFDENPPYSRQGSEEAFVHEQAMFANISDYSYSIDDLRVDLLGGVAVSTFYLTYNGIFVNDYLFEGSPVGSKVRATMVLIKTKEGWKIAHQHFSRFPELRISKSGS